MSRFMDDDDDAPNTKTIYVRPDRPITLDCHCYSYFGSGSGSARLTVSGGAILGPVRETRRNGCLAWSSRSVTLPSGATARVVESYYPGGGRDTNYIADLDGWRTQRRQHLAQLFTERRLAREFAAQEAARSEEIVARYEAARAKLRALESDAYHTALGRTGGRARRRAVRLRAVAADQRRLVDALASTVSGRLPSSHTGQCVPTPGCG